MNPHQRLSWTLALSLMIWAPVALSVLGNRIELVRGGLLYIGSLLFSWAGTGVIERITNSYRVTQHNLYRAKQQIERIERQAKLQAEHNNAKPTRRANDAEADD